MFKKDNKAKMTTGTTGGDAGPVAGPVVEPARQAPRTAAGEHSVISAGLRVIGNLQSDEDVEVLGVVEGDISSRSLTVSAGARVEGSITAGTVNIAGSVSGQVIADRVTIAKTGEMSGDVTYKTLAIDEGAAFDGNCHYAKPERKESEGLSNLKPVQSASGADQEAGSEPAAASAGGRKSSKAATGS